MSINNTLYIFKEDRPFYLDSGGDVQTLTNITSPIATTNGGKNSIAWNGKLYMPWGKALLERDGSTFPLGLPR